jgi:uncharacterized protein (DUF1501 family)
MSFVHAPMRRQLLLSAGALFAWAYLPKVARAEGRDPRLLTIVLRGALDGLAAVAPVGDPNWVALRGEHALTLDGKTPALPIDGFFALHPAMPNLHRMFVAREAIVVHACATPYRERSHLGGQRMLESWLTRLQEVVSTQPRGPRVGVLMFDGWDTHYNQGTANGRLAQLLGALDSALAVVKTSIGPAWRESVVVVTTEFGRTAHINEGAGTDHGTGTLALLAGGALKGGRVIADWPGLRPADLYESRDLKATTDLRAVLKGLLRDHLRADETELAEYVFRGSAGVKPMAGLV